MYAVFLTFFAGGSFAQDPPARVARLNFISGAVSMQPAGVDEWGPAALNRPFTTGDYLYTDQGAFAELHTDLAVIRMSPLTSFGFLNLNDQIAQLKLSEGNLYIRVRNLNPNQVFEVDTPNAALTFVQNGIYRVDVDPNGQTSFVVVRTGEMQVTGGGQSFLLEPAEAANIWGTDQLGYEVLAAPDRDPFDNWCMQRDARESSLASARYLPPTVIGYEDLDDYGDWQTGGSNGPVWYPRSVVGGWAPYHNGHWAWVDPWGWTWVDDAPWGFAPFHYGRWAYINNRWGWAPGPVVIGYQGPVVRPYYAPAMVAFFGGAHFGVSVSVGGGGPSLGWVSLGLGEVFTPWYHCSQPYFQRVNTSNTTIVKTVNITNIYNNVYVNKTVYNQTYVNVKVVGAVTAMPQSAFASGRSVSQAGVVVEREQISRLQQSSGAAAVLAPPVAPSRQAFLPTASQSAPRPPAQVMQRQVVARVAPPPPPVPVAQKVAFIQQHPGQTFDHAQMRAAVAPAAAPAVAVVRQAPKASPVKVTPGAHVGNVAAFHQTAAAQAVSSGRAVGAPGQPAPARPNPAPQPEAKQTVPATGQNAKPTTPQPQNRPVQAQQNKPAATNPVVQQSKPVQESRPVPEKENKPVTAVKPQVQPDAHPVAKPAVEAARPAPQIAKPAAEAAKPAPQPVRPAVEAARPAPQPAKPAVEAARPAPQPAKPAVEVARPAPQPAKPAVEVAKPATPVKPVPEAHGTPPNQHPVVTPTKEEKKDEKNKNEKKKDTKETKDTKE